MTEYAKGKHPNSLANLRPWQQGVSGNPVAQRGPIITPHLRRFIQLGLPAFMRLDLYRMTVAENIAARLLYEALQSGYDRSTDLVVNRLDGMMKGDVTINADGAGDVKVALVWSTGGEKAAEPQEKAE